MAHVPPPAEWKDKMKWQQVTSTITSHDHLPRSLSAAHRVMIALPPPKCHHNSTKYLPAIKEAIKASDTIYINLHTRRRVSLLYLVKGQLIYLSPKPWLTKPLEGGCPNAFFAGITTESRTYFGWGRASIHLATTWNTRSARYQHQWILLNITQRMHVSQPRFKILINMNILVLEFYGCIGIREIS